MLKYQSEELNLILNCMKEQFRIVKQGCQEELDEIEKAFLTVNF